MNKLYATINDYIAFRKNEKGEPEPYTVEGERIITDIPVSGAAEFADKCRAIKTLYPGAAVRFMKGK